MKKKLYLKSLVYTREIIMGLIFSNCNSIGAFTIKSMFVCLKDSGFSIVVQSIFWRLKRTDSEGTTRLYPERKDWRTEPIAALRSLIESGIDFEIIGDNDELDFLADYSPPLYDKIESKVIWKAKKRGNI